jgi:hypothetical protein
MGASRGGCFFTDTHSAAVYQGCVRKDSGTNTLTALFSLFRIGSILEFFDEEIGVYDDRRTKE